MPPAVFILKCLGYPELRGPDGKVVRIRVKKHLALMTYLAVERRRYHDRERLVGLLWPNVSTKKGRHSIATAISFLRTVFGRGAFPTNRNAIRFTPVNLQLDLDRLEAGRVLGAEGEADLDVDGFLQTFDIHDAPEFGLWKEREHARRLPAIHAGLLTLIDHGRRRGSHDEIMQRAERLLALDHLAEEGIRAKMEALALVGDRFSALRVFDEWKSQLADELGAEPSMLVDGMASQLRKRGWEPKEPNPVPAVPAEQWRDRRFVGRKAEYRKLYETWEAVHQYRPQHFMIAGDSGVGKTTLAQRLVTAAGLEGASVSRVQCYQMEQRIPFGTIGGLVAGLLGRPGVAATAPEALAEVARIVPQVKDHFATLPPPKPSEGESARLLFAEGVMDLLRAVMEERPLLLVVDDLHHADEASMAVLHLVMRRIVEGRFMVALTVRSDTDTGTAATRFAASTEVPLVRTGLEPMPAEECEELLTMMLESSSPPPPSERRAIVRASRGFPMVLELLAQDWALNGENCIGLALRAITAELPNTQPGSADPLASLAHRMLPELGNAARQVLTLGAILGQRLNDLSVFSLIGLTLAQTMEGISELMARRIIRDVGNGLEFMNELVRAHAYRTTPSPVRVLLHGSIADRLLNSARNETKAASGLEIAWHLMRAHRTVEAGEHLMVGARAALIEGAPDEVVLSLRSSLSQLSEPLRTTATIVLIEALHELGYWAEALQFAAANEDSPDTSIFRVYALEARWQLGVLSLEDQRNTVDELIRLAQKQPDLASKAIGLAAFMSGVLREESVAARVRMALPPVEAQQGQARAVLLMARANLHYQARQIEEGEQDIDAARVTLDQLGATDSSRAKLEIGAGVFCMAKGKYLKGAELAEQALQLARRLDNKRLADLAATNAAICYTRLGSYHDALRHARSVGPGADMAHYCNAAFAECSALIDLGRHEEVLDRLRLADREASRIDHVWLRQRWYLDRADLLLLMGRRGQAKLQADAAIADPFSRPLARANIGPFVRWATNLERCRPSVLDLDSLLKSALESKSDSLDRLEILAALRSRSYRPRPDISLALERELVTLNQELPAAAVRRIEALNRGWCDQSDPGQP